MVRAVKQLVLLLALSSVPLCLCVKQGWAEANDPLLCTSSR